MGRAGVRPSLCTGDVRLVGDFGVERFSLPCRRKKCGGCSSNWARQLYLLLVDRNRMGLVLTSQSEWTIAVFLVRNIRKTTLPFGGLGRPDFFTGKILGDIEKNPVGALPAEGYGP